MIPRIIHFCWFGGNPYPEKVQTCIESWKINLPEYEIICWDENNFDINVCNFTKEAYEAGKYAFVSDYVRLFVLKQYGGIYLDVDVEVVKSFDPILNNHLILALEEAGDITGAFIASEPNHPFWDEMMNIYHGMSFKLPDGTYNMVVNNVWMQDVLNKYGYEKKNVYQVLSNGAVVYPDDYFHAKSLVSGEVRRTKNTYCIHHHTLLWVSKKTKFIRFMRMKILVPLLGADRYQRIVSRLKGE